MLTGYYWPGDPDDKDIVVFFHGRGAHQGVGAKYAQYIAGHGDNVLVASYRGFGGNPGQPSKPGLLKDADAFIAEARKRAGAGARLWLVGHSRSEERRVGNECVRTGSSRRSPYT